MDITPGEFESFRSHSSRIRHSDTRSSMRSDTTGSLEILPPEEAEDKDRLFMSEELSDEEVILDESSFHNQNNNAATTSDKNRQSRASSTSSASSSPYHMIMDEDPKLRKLIKKMKKYDKMLQLSTKKEKEVKLQRLLFQKQMLDELSLAESKIEDKLSNNQSRFLALMPPPERLQEMVVELQKEEPHPIFQTQLLADESTARTVRGSPRREDNPEDDSLHIPSNTESDLNKSGMKKKIDFIKRNIELAKDGGNYMTDDEKVRLNELLSDLDEVTDNETIDVKEAFTQLTLVGQGYTPSEEDGKRLAEIDEKIQTFLPENEFFMICGTPHLSARSAITPDAYDLAPEFKPSKLESNINVEEVQKRLEDLDNEWKKTFEGTTPRLTDEQLQKLLDECSLSRSSVNSSLSLRTLTESQASYDDFRHSSLSNTSSRTGIPPDKNYHGDGSWDQSQLAIVEQLPEATLNRLLTEEGTSLGLPPSDTTDGQSDEDSNSCQSPVFHRVQNIDALSGEGDLHLNNSVTEKMSLEEV